MIDLLSKLKANAKLWLIVKIVLFVVLGLCVLKAGYDFLQGFVDGWNDKL